MCPTVLHAPRDVWIEDRPTTAGQQPTDAVIRTAATCACGSDLWPSRGAGPTDAAHPMDHEYVGIVEEVGSEMTAGKPGQFVVGSLAASDETCANCRNGFQPSCLNHWSLSICQADYVHNPHAQGTLVATHRVPDERFWPGLLAVSDVTGPAGGRRPAADKPGTTALVVGDGV
ncbi:alcohol dehydrogenase catalytic domain-containing protein [Streptomyces sp. CL12-4]|nr:alcohol dehydrogenase catalytic domain-containing protein [Streptomyces sp. CL12-4]